MRVALGMCVTHWCTPGCGRSNSGSNPDILPKRVLKNNQLNIKNKLEGTRVDHRVGNSIIGFSSESLVFFRAIRLNHDRITDNILF